MGTGKDAINSLLSGSFSLLVEHGGCSCTSNAAVCTNIKCVSHTGRATAFNAALSLLGAGLSVLRKKTSPDLCASLHTADDAKETHVRASLISRKGLTCCLSPGGRESPPMVPAPKAIYIS